MGPIEAEGLSRGVEEGMLALGIGHKSKDRSASDGGGGNTVSGEVARLPTAKAGPPREACGTRFLLRGRGG